MVYYNLKALMVSHFIRVTRQQGGRYVANPFYYYTSQPLHIYTYNPTIITHNRRKKDKKDKKNTIGEVCRKPILVPTIITYKYEITEGKKTKRLKKTKKIPLLLLHPPTIIAYIYNVYYTCVLVYYTYIYTLLMSLGEPQKYFL